MDDFERESQFRQIQQETGILGESDKVRQLIETIDQVASTDISVLVTGESGTGKELVGKAIHQLSRRSNEPIITVNCGAIPEGILESELFGHEKGSFTGAVGARKGYFELANNGSIFLDEIGELPLSIQVKLLRVLEEREFIRVGGTTVHQVNIRLIAATNKNLEQEVEKGNFRQDLFYRLNVMNITVPPLRERIADIPILVNKFSNDFVRNNLIEFEGFTESGLHKMQEYSWPGNIRELRNLVEKVIVLERGRKIDDFVLDKYIKPFDRFDKSLPVHLNKPKDELEREFLLRALLEIKSEIAQLRELMLSCGMQPKLHLGPWREDLAYEYVDQSGENVNNKKSDMSVSDMEKEMILNALSKTGGNKRKAAGLLGMSERTLYRKINRFGLNDDE